MKIRNLLVATVALVSLSACGHWISPGYALGVSAAHAQENAADMIQMEDQMFTPSVQLVIDQTSPATSPRGFCSGEIIHSDRDKISGKVETFVLTAKHCTEDINERMMVVVDDYDKTNRIKKYEYYKAKVWGRSWKSDLALIKLDDTETVFEKVAKVAPADMVLTFGDPVELVGYPYGLSKTWTEGRLGYVEDMSGIAFGGLSDSNEFYRATPMMIGGSSGSSMFTKDTDGDYKIIGVLTGGAAGYMGFYTPLNEIHDYLDTAMEAWKTGPKAEDSDKDLKKASH